MAPLGLKSRCSSTRSPTAETEVVLKRDLGSGHLPLVGLAANLPVELGALREPRGAKRMPLRDEATGRIHHHLAAIRRGT